MNNETKQTAIDWLIEQWPILESDLPNWLIQKAKEMEKEKMWEYITKNYCIGPKSLEFHKLEFEKSFETIES